MSVVTSLAYIQQCLTRYGITTYLILGDIGLLLNIIIFSQLTHRRNPVACYILAMSFCGFIGLNISVIPYIYGLDHLDPLTTSLLFCQLHRYLRHVFNQMMRTFFVLSCADRYIVTSQHVYIRSFSRYQIAICVIPCVIIFWFILGFFPTLLGSLLNNTCNSNTGIFAVAIAIYMPIVVGIIPLACMVMFGILLYNNLKKIQTRVQPNSSSNQTFRKRDRDILRMLLIEAICHIVTTTPLATMLIYSSVTRTATKTNEQRQIESFINYLTAVFTVVITFEQKKESDYQRFEDRDLARIQREQDLNVSREQRTLERTLADEKRTLEIDLSERVRNSNIEQRRHEVHVQEENRRDAELTRYMTEMGQLIKENNGSLTNDLMIHALARAKTLHTIRQIGPSRCVQLIHFLYDAKQLTNTGHSLDLSGALFNGIDLSGDQSLMTNLVLSSVYLSNASFANLKMQSWNLSGTHLHGANFSESDLIDVIFSKAVLTKSDFSNARISGFASFSDADLTESSFYRASILGNHFFDTNLRQVNFTEIKLDGILSDSNLVNSSFHLAKIRMSSFLYCNMTGTDLTDAIVSDTDFEGSILVYATLVRAHLQRVSFLYSNLSYANFHNADKISKSQLNRAISLHAMIYPDGTRNFNISDIQLNIDVRCSMIVLDEWKVDFGKVSVQPFFDVEYGPENCVIAPTNISLNSSIKNEKAVLVVGPARIGSQTHVVVRQRRWITNNNFEEWKKSISKLRSSSVILDAGSIIFNLESPLS
ncbi:hypothetical protein I4U23_027614 [Adineta vaga]|nr:hypothetical protein I4U23_027614 [Adineta vaga]